MPKHNFEIPRGRIEWVAVRSEALASNRLGDPSTRQVAVYLPPGYDDGDATYPLFVALAAFTGSGHKLMAWQAFGESLPQRLDRLVAEGAMGPVVLAMPDCFTSLGGNQYIDSPVMGEWARFLTADMLRAIEDRFRVIADRSGRAVFGHSSGGYGALVHGMRHADTWGAVASHSGDAGFELLYRPEFPKALAALARRGEDAETFVARVAGERKISGGDFYALMSLAMAATYAPELDAPLGVRLPVDPHTCELDPERWARWLAHDPVHMAERSEHLDALRSLRGLFIDVGNRDQYFLHFGNRALVRRLEAAGVPHVYEEFDDDHSKVDYRYDRSLPFLYRALMSS